MYVERNASATICLWTFCHVTLRIVFHYIYREKDRCIRQRNRKRPRSMQNLKHVMRFQILLLMTSKTKQSLQQHCDPYVFMYVCMYICTYMYVCIYVCISFAINHKHVGIYIQNSLLKAVMAKIIMLMM